MHADTNTIHENNLTHTVI